MELAAPLPAGNTRSLVTVATDAVAWLVVFILVGAPVFPASSSNASAPAPSSTSGKVWSTTLLTTMFALLVAALWPCSLIQWCVLLANENVLKPQAIAPSATGRDERTATKAGKSGEGPTRGGGSKANPTACVEVEAAAPTGPAAADPSTGVSTKSPVRVLCESCVLSLAILLGGLGPQLDWQLQLQAWPFPSLLFFLVAWGGCMAAYHRSTRQSAAAASKKLL